ncbi:MAG: hypothetical protein KAR06_04850 [Deltaproteobacteria bacterium]|nr:hypothetical protein [Deltaproteobacteria bacterium]
MFRAIMLTGKAHEVFDALKVMAKEHPTRTIGEMAENIKSWKQKHGLL